MEFLNLTSLKTIYSINNNLNLTIDKIHCNKELQFIQGVFVESCSHDNVHPYSCDQYCAAGTRIKRQWPICLLLQQQKFT